MNPEDISLRIEWIGDFVYVVPSARLTGLRQEIAFERLSACVGSPVISLGEMYPEPAVSVPVDPSALARLRRAIRLQRTSSAMLPGYDECIAGRAFEAADHSHATRRVPYALSRGAFALQDEAEVEIKRAICDRFNAFVARIPA